VGSSCGVLPSTPNLHLFDAVTGSSISNNRPATEGAKHERPQQ
jgi:hypothetical protein